MPDIVIRPATAADVAQIHAMIGELATYERAADQVRATPEMLAAALFGPSPAVHALMAESEGTAAGFALWFTTFSTWEGVHGLYLEDLFVRPEHRGTGLGRRLLAELAGIAASCGWARVEWAVLDWNTPAIGFYERLGARPQDEWTTYRLTGEALSALARRSARA